ncbi:unnamed protein product [Prorocentrum cordatum]|uniref:Uncharacterized protein n=1 Tax=Prorocentrum cordatum TaxID=2364126 RepID=A0ABN9R6Y6_9DINO|nr:unnamed protein product [Polarella glacialis]
MESCQLALRSDGHTDIAHPVEYVGPAGSRARLVSAGPVRLGRACPPTGGFRRRVRGKQPLAASSSLALPPEPPPRGGRAGGESPAARAFADPDQDAVEDRDDESDVWVAVEAVGDVKGAAEVHLEDSGVVEGDRALIKLSPDVRAFARDVKGGVAMPAPRAGRADGDRGGKPAKADRLLDARILSPVRYVTGGRRWGDFANFVGRRHGEPMEDFPLESERSTMWLMRCERGHGGTFDSRQTKWFLEHRIERATTARLMHDLLGLALDLDACYDQPGVANLGCIKRISRMYQLCEETTGSLQLEGLEHHLGRDRAVLVASNAGWLSAVFWPSTRRTCSARRRMC